MRNFWPNVKLGQHCAFRNGLNFTQHDRGHATKIVGVSDFWKRSTLRDFSEVSEVALSTIPSDEDLLSDGDLLFVRSNGNKELVGRCMLVFPGDLHVSFSGFTIRGRLNLDYFDPRFVSYIFQSDLFRRHLMKEGAGTNISNLSQDILARFELPMPSLPEQRRIVSVIEIWDKAIDASGRLVCEKEKLLAALQVRIFERAISQGGLIDAKSMLAPISEKARPDLPLLAVMQDIGIVRRDELDRRVAMPDGDGSTYKVVRPGDFVISLRSFEGGLEYSTIEGLVSPAYTVLRPIREIVPGYYRHFFKSLSFIRRLDRLVFGIRDGKQIAFRDFGSMKIPNPSLDQQAAAVNQLDAASSNVRLSRNMARALSVQKRGIMQKLMAGECSISAVGVGAPANAGEAAE